MDSNLSLLLLLSSEIYQSYLSKTTNQSVSPYSITYSHLRYHVAVLVAPGVSLQYQAAIKETISNMISAINSTAHI
jgi:hypothetical protein